MLTNSLERSIPPFTAFVIFHVPLSFSSCTSSSVFAWSSSWQLFKKMIAAYNAMSTSRLFTDFMILVFCCFMNFATTAQKNKTNYTCDNHVDLGTDRMQVCAKAGTLLITKVSKHATHTAEREGF